MPCARCLAFLAAIRYDWHADLNVMHKLRRHWDCVHAQQGRVDPFAKSKLGTFSERLWYRLCRCRNADDSVAACQEHNLLAAYYHLVGTEADRDALGQECLAKAVQLPRACPITLNTLYWNHSYGLYGHTEDKNLARNYLYHNNAGRNPVASFNKAAESSDANIKNHFLHLSATTPLYFGAGAPPQWRHNVNTLRNGFNKGNRLLSNDTEYEPVRKCYLRAAAKQGDWGSQCDVLRQTVPFQRYKEQVMKTPLHDWSAFSVAVGGPMPKRFLYFAALAKAHQRSLVTTTPETVCRDVITSLLVRAMWLTKLLRMPSHSPFNRVMSVETFASCILQRACTFRCSLVPQLRLVLPIHALTRAAQYDQPLHLLDRSVFLSHCMPQVDAFIEDFYRPDDLCTH